ncbi:MAG TPA: hypothetical protein VE084_00490 [Burkholderiaceae bacterium]|nr:hypothetical protein [Burkholderiaceae bacterium]
MTTDMPLRAIQRAMNQAFAALGAPIGATIEADETGAEALDVLGMVLVHRDGTRFAVTDTTSPYEYDDLSDDMSQALNEQMPDQLSPVVWCDTAQDAVAAALAVLGPVLGPTPVTVGRTGGGMSIALGGQLLAWLDAP